MLSKYFNDPGIAKVVWRYLGMPGVRRLLVQQQMERHIHLNVISHPFSSFKRASLFNQIRVDWKRAFLIFCTHFFFCFLLFSTPLPPFTRLLSLPLHNIHDYLLQSKPHIKTTSIIMTPPPASESKEQKPPTATTLPGMTGPLIGNGPGYTNGKAIALPILSSFSKKMQLSAASDNKATATTASAPSTPTKANGATLAAPVHIPSSVASVSPSSTASTPASKTAPFSSATTSPQLNANGSNGQLACARGGADAGIVVVSGGTACNSLVQQLQDMTPNVTYVCMYPVSLYY